MTIGAQELISHTPEFKADEGCACCGEARGRGERDFDFIWQRLHLTPSITEGERYGACTARKSIQTQSAGRQR